MNTRNPDLKPCTRCKTAITTLRVDGEPVCSTCKAMDTTYDDELLPCVDCKTMKTRHRHDGEPLCATCCNERYYAKKRRGEIVEIKLDLTKVKQSTYLQIQALIQKDMEEAAKKQ